MERIIEEIVNKDVLIVSPETSIAELIKKFISHRTDFAVILDNEKLLGVVAEKDILKIVKIGTMSMEAVIAPDIPEQIGKKTVSEIMTTHPITIEKHMKIIDAIKLLATQDITHVPVLDDDKFFGILSVFDIFKTLV